MNPNQRIILVVVVVALVGATATTALYLASGGSTGGHRALPPGCVKPPGGFLIIASNTGYNDSVHHQTLNQSWPVIDIHQGQTVNITVCNTDVEPHGFQITHYYDSSVETVEPGQVLHVAPFVADKTGSFRIYCSIFCAIHIYMQDGQLIVTA